MHSNRREFLRGAAASVFATNTLGLQSSPIHEPDEHARPRTKGSDRPNVVFLICDDLGYGDLGCYGASIPTPHLDNLAAEGTRCIHHNSAHPICSASRAALLTGRYAPRSHTPGALFPHAKVAMAREEQTLADLFRARGYRTHAIGKWHLGDENGYRPTERGFDTYFGVPWSDDMKPLPLFRETTLLEQDTDRDELTPRYTDEAVRLLEDRSDAPFFLYLAYSYPHDPARGSKAFKGRSEFGDFGDAVEEIDWSVGKILEAIERSGKAHDTIIFFTSDHGPWFQGSPALMRGRKGSTFEGGVRVPMIIRWPNHIPSSTVSRVWLSHLDVLPTLSAWCGLEKTKLPLDGFDASLTLLHGAVGVATPVLYFAANGTNDVHCIRSGEWKLRIAQNDGEIYISDRGSGRISYLLPKPELYNLQRDPSESYDVAKRHPDLVGQLQGELNRLIGTFPPEIQASYTSLRGRVASVVTPPGAAPRTINGSLPDWAWEPPDRR